ncbi:MAG: glycosyltransferase, partial [Bacilli bacterium]|nr:glycosyltransferase [Bacilli bacterium]
MKKDTIEVVEKVIHGIKNPSLTVKVIIDLNNYEFEIICDGKKVEDYRCIPLADNRTIALTANLPSKCKKIKVNIKQNKKTYNVCSLNNYMFFRVGNRILAEFNKIFARIRLFFHVLYKGTRFLWKEYHFLVPPKLIKKYLKDFKNSIKGSTLRFYEPFDQVDYNKWLDKNQTITEYEKQKYEPLISILIPAYNIRRDYLSECLDSILNQNYKNFEVCLVDDCSTLEETKETLKEYEEKDKRIRVKYRKKNGHISKTTNDALKMAKGEFIALVDDDDLLTEDALFENVLVLNKDKNIDFIYSDEDKMDERGTFCEPHFKADFSPDTLLSHNYICHFSVIRKSLVDSVGGFEVGLEGSQDHDLFLKVTEKAKKIYHIPKVLYHWRMVQGSTSMTLDNKNYALDKGKKAIENALKRRNIKAHVERDELSKYHLIAYEFDKEPLVSIIIPTRDYVDITKKCVDSIFNKTTYKNF